jgi:Spy/CpxP family protein refolding chaperone
MKLGSILIAAALAGGLLSAQDQPRARMQPRGDFGGGPMSERWLNKTLTLSAEQSNKIHTIFSEANVSRQADMTRMQTLHKSLTDAVKSGNESAIDSITRDMATMHQAQQATHAKTLAKIYATLTPDQQAKVATDLEHAVGGPGPGMGRRGGPPPARQQQ